jgi:hypothetical protein
MMRILQAAREFLHGKWLRIWSQILAGELIAVSQPKTDARR